MFFCERAHASHPLNGIVGGGMLWCALALLVSQPPQPCLGYAQRKNPSYATPHAAPLKRGEDALAPPPLPAVLYTAATRCCAMLC